MNTQKTGALIAQCRSGLGLTQKQLAEQLNLSDRTISRWERGVGFPDIAMLEPLADTLGISVLELLHGERMEAPPPEVELTIRDTTRNFGARLKTTVRRFRWALVVLAALLLLAVCTLFCLWFQGYLDRWTHMEEISAPEALAICPYALITTEDYEFVQRLLQDEDLTALLPDEWEESHFLTEEDLASADASILSRYEDSLFIDGEPAELVFIDVIYCTIYVTYVSGNRRCDLVFSPYQDTIAKSCAQYDGDCGDLLYVISNQNNQSFSIMKESSRLSLLFSE